MQPVHGVASSEGARSFVAVGMAEKPQTALNEYHGNEARDTRDSSTRNTLDVKYEISCGLRSAYVNASLELCI